MALSDRPTEIERVKAEIERLQHYLKRIESSDDTLPLRVLNLDEFQIEFLKENWRIKTIADIVQHIDRIANFSYLGPKVRINIAATLIEMGFLSPCALDALTGWQRLIREHSKPPLKNLAVRLVTAIEKAKSAAQR